MTIFIILGCNAELAVTEIYEFPKALEEKFTFLKNDEYVQMINESGGIKYIIINTGGTVTLEAESKSNSVLFNIEESDIRSDVIERHIFKITLDKEYEFVKLYCNGEEISSNIYLW